MRSIRILAVTLLVACLLSPQSADAQGSRFHGVVKSGAMLTSLDGMGTPINAGLMVGYQLFEGGPYYIDAEFSTSVIKGDVDLGGSSADWGVQTIALFGTYQSQGKTYWKVRMGVLNENVTISASGIGISGSDTGMSIGLGAGHTFGFGRLEVEYMTVEQDIDYLGFGFVIPF